MVYRSDVEALAARLASLEADLELRIRERDDVAGLLDAARAEHRDAERPPRHHVAIAVVVAFALLAVGIARLFAAIHERSPRSSSSVALIMFQAFELQMCACRDASCAQRVSDDMMRWFRDHATPASDYPKLSQAEQWAAQQMGERMGRCMQDAIAIAVPPASSEP